MLSYDLTRFRGMVSRLALLSFVAAILVLPNIRQASAAETKKVISSVVADPVVYYRTVEVDGLDIFYREAGPNDAPTVLLLHGFPTSSHMFRNLIPSLADRYHVVAPDYPGYGYSSMPRVDEFEYTFDSLATVVEKFTEKVGLTKYSIYLMDYGAPVGFRVAVKHPERVETLIVQNGNAYDEGIDNDFWKPIKEYWNNRNEGTRRQTAVPTDARGDEVAVHTWRTECREDQPRYVGACAAASGPSWQSGNPTGLVPQLR